MFQILDSSLLLRFLLRQHWENPVRDWPLCPVSIKDVRSQGGRWSLSSADIFRTRRFFRCGRLHFLVQKHRIIRNLWCVRIKSV